MLQDGKGVDNMLCLVVLFVLAAAASGQQTVIRPQNLKLCEEFGENVNRSKTDVFVVQPQQHEFCSSLTNITSTSVVCRHCPLSLSSFVNFELLHCSIS